MVHQRPFNGGKKYLYRERLVGKPKLASSRCGRNAGVHLNGKINVEIEEVTRRSNK